MSEQTSLEMIAPTIDEAIAQGLAELGLTEDDVDVEVLDEGSRGILNLGSRHARVRITVKEEESSPAPTYSDQPTPEGQDPNTLEIAGETVRELLDKMGVHAEVSCHWGEQDGDRYPAPVMVDISGDDLSILIGRRAETLEAFQYITRLIVGKELGHSSNINVDVAGYRQRRERNLRDLANKMADQAMSQGRRQTLEPMPPNERRIIHMELQDRNDVYTESVGEGSRRKLTIIPAD